MDDIVSNRICSQKSLYTFGNMVSLLCVPTYQIASVNSGKCVDFVVHGQNTFFSL